MANQTCEQCGASFPEPTGPVEVVSTRILCPTCAEARRQAKLAAKGAAAAPVAAKAAAPASARSASANSAPAARPAPASSSRSASSASKPAASVPRPSVPTPIAGAARSKVETQRLAGKKATSQDLDEVRREARALKEKDNRVLMIGWVAGLVILGIAGGVMMYSKATQKHRVDTIAAYDKENEDILAKIKTFDATKEDGAKALKAYLESLGSKSKRDELKEEVNTANIRVARSLEGFIKQREFMTRLDKLESDVKNAGSLSSEQLQTLRVDRDTLESEGGGYGGDVLARLGSMRGTLDLSYARKLHTELSALPTAGAGAKATLTRYAQVEDIISAMWMKAAKDSNKALKEPLDAVMQAMVKEADEICSNVFTPEYIESQPWTDLLRGEQATRWVKSPAPGFSYDINSRGELRIIGPDPESKGDGVISIGDKDKWRDFVAELDLEITRGKFDMYVRAPVSSLVNVPVYGFTTEGEDALARGTAYPLRVKVIASSWEVSSDSSEFSSSEDMPLIWWKPRVGAIAFSVPIGTEFSIKKFRIKVLR